MPRQFICYHTPPATCTQSVRFKTVFQAWDAVSEFMATCTDTTTPETGKLILYGCVPEAPAFDVAPIVEQLSHHLGPAMRQTWMNCGREDSSYDWALSGPGVEGARQIIRAQPWPKSRRSPVQVELHYYFRWIDPSTRELLPFQEPEDFEFSWKPKSWLHVTLQPNSHAFLIWKFPFEQPNGDFLRYLETVRRIAPVELPDRHFRLMVPNKKGTDYVARKIDPAALAGA